MILTFLDQRALMEDLEARKSEYATLFVAVVAMADGPFF